MSAQKKRTTFPEALAKLLRKRKIRVPAGLSKAPPEAYANQPASFVEQLAALEDEALRAQAEKVAGWSRRQSERAKTEWDTSPVVAEIRRRKLKEPPRPRRVVGASVSLRKPLSEWTDRELLEAAAEWSDRGRA